MNSTDFYYNGKFSTEMGVYLVNVESGLRNNPFLPEKEIISETIPENDIPYIFQQKRKPLVLNLTLSTLDELWTFEKRREVARWLDTGRFEKFYRQDELSKMYYLQYVGGIDLTHNSSEQGYINVQMINISPFAYSPIYIKSHDLSSITSPTIIEFVNNGDSTIYPELWINKIENGDVSIVNLSNGGKEFKFTGLVNNEEVYIDSRPSYHHIETNLAETYRYDNFNGNYLEILPYSVNRLQVTGKCKLKFQYEFEIKG